MDYREYLIDSFKKFGYELSDTQTDQFMTYASMLVEWNEKMNLTAITEFQDIVWKHFIDSAAVLQSEYVSRETMSGHLIDVGTGAGFPGIPLKILFPNLKVTLLDSLNKRILFLQEVVKACDLKNVETIHGRAEDVAKDAGHREKYDVCVSRAVANLSTLSEYCIPFIRKGGTFISYKSSEIQEELNNSRKAIKIFGGAVQNTESFILRGTDIPRSLVIIRKVDTTPRKYPRKAGTPAKSPL